jgi:hypothetical protein
MTAPMSKAKRRTSDVGGLPAGPIDRSDHEPEPWQKLLHAFVMSAGAGGLNIMVNPEFRRTREDIHDVATYESFKYFERWTRTFVHVLEEKGVMTRAEVAARAEEIKRRLKAGR